MIKKLLINIKYSFTQLERSKPQTALGFSGGAFYANSVVYDATALRIFQFGETERLK